MRHVLHLGFSASLSLSLSLRKPKVSCVLSRCRRHLSSTPPSSLVATPPWSLLDASVISPRHLTPPWSLRLRLCDLSSWSLLEDYLSSTNQSKMISRRLLRSSTTPQWISRRLFVSISSISLSTAHLDEEPPHISLWPGALLDISFLSLRPRALLGER